MTALCRAPTLTSSGGEREASKMWCSRIGGSSPRVAAVSSALGVSSSAAAVELLPCGGREESAAAVDEVGGMLAMPHVPRGNGDGRTLSMGSIVDHRRKVRPPEPRTKQRFFGAKRVFLLRVPRRYFVKTGQQTRTGGATARATCERIRFAGRVKSQDIWSISRLHGAAEQITKFYLLFLSAVPR